MNIVKFYKDKIVTFVYDEEKEDWVEKNIEELYQPITFCFGKLVDFDQDFTVFDFIKHLNKNKEIIDTFFIGYNNGIRIQKFYDECLEKKEAGYSDKIKEIEIAWETDIYKDETINFRFVNDWTTFFGRVIKEYEYEVGANIPIRSVNLIRLRNWKHLPLKLNRFIYFQEIDINKKRKVYTKLSGIKEFTLMDVICGFLKELTWYGDPERQVEVAKEIAQKFKEMKEEGKEEILIDVKKPVYKHDLKHLEDELKKCIDEEDYLKAKSIKEKIDTEKKNQEQ
jgi:hypothetical protein